MDKRAYLKELLNEYPHLDEYIKRLNAELTNTLNNKEEQTVYLKANIIDLSGIHRHAIIDPVSAIVMQLSTTYEEHIQYLIGQINFYIERRQLIGRMLASLDARERKIMDLTHYSKLKWLAITSKLNISRSTLDTYRSNIYKKLEAFLED